MKVFALVGQSGTGKSHRASEVAANLGVDMILDDGLLVENGRIIAGRSAKREETMVAAVKRAVLVDPAHARNIRESIDRVNPSGLLILATSRHMLDRIRRALHIDDEPCEILSIEEVSTAEDIARARQTRQELGKHVIPAPTFEVRKTFAGYLVDPLRFIVRNQRRQEVVEKSVVRPTYSSLGKFFIDDTVVSTIAAHVALRVRGVERVGRVQTESYAEGVRCALDLTVETGHYLPAVLESVQQVVRLELERATALQILGVDVTARHLVVRRSKGA
jgi:uncharacterized alkaline shock family protein YloU/adenylate kinase family enzyme